MSQASNAERKIEAPGALARTLTLRHFIGIGINMCIGGSIFLIGADAFRMSREWSLVVAACVGTFSLGMGLVVAEVSSRFSTTGGAYTYARAAFGPFCGFLVAWLTWFTRVLAQASLTNGIVTSAAAFFGGGVSQMVRVIGIIAITILIALVHLRRVEQGARTIMAFSLVKLMPLLFVIGAGFATGAIGRVEFGPPPTGANLVSTALLLLFSFSGYEVIPATAGEGRNPRRDAPVATVMSVMVMVVCWLLLQLILIRTVPLLALQPRPVADAGEIMAGPWAGSLVNVGAILSALGTCLGTLLAASRNLYAVGADGLIPTWFARVRPGTLVPSNAIMFSTLVVVVLACSGTFVFLAAAAAIPRLLVFFVIAACLLRFRQKRTAPFVAKAAFMLPGGRIIAVLAMLICLAVTLGVSSAQLLFGGGGLVVGMLLYWIGAHRAG